MSVLFYFSTHSFLYYFAKAYIHKKLEVKQNETSKKYLVLDQDSMGSTAIKEEKLLNHI